MNFPFQVLQEHSSLIIFKFQTPGLLQFCSHTLQQYIYFSTIQPLPLPLEARSGDRLGQMSKSLRWQICHPNKGCQENMFIHEQLSLLISCMVILQGTCNWIFDALHNDHPSNLYNLHSISKIIQSKSNLKHWHPHPYRSQNHTAMTLWYNSQPINSTLNLAGDSDKRLLSTWSCEMISKTDRVSPKQKHVCRCRWQSWCKLLHNYIHSQVTGMGNALDQEPMSSSSQINIFHQLGTFWSQSHLMGNIIQRVLMSQRRRLHFHPSTTCIIIHK